MKTVRFRQPTYLGDPVNILRIFNDKEVPEVMVLDIDSTVRKQAPKLAQIGAIAGECFMPFGYGGGLSSLQMIECILSLGVEKIVLNTAAFHEPRLVTEAAKNFGSQSIVAGIDVGKDWLGRYRVYVCGGRRRTTVDPVTHAKRMEDAGAGELLVTSIERDGTMRGYDLELLRAVTPVVSVPVIASGGAGQLEHFRQAVTDGGASAVAAGSMFVFQGRHRAVLANYPTPTRLREFIA